MFYLRERLAAAGIAGKEAKLYLAALETGEAPVHVIAKHAGIGRTTAYDVLNRLIEQGMATRHEKHGRIYIVPEPPEQLLKRHETRLDRLRDLLPELKALHGVSPIQPRIRLYEGEVGICTVLQNTLDCKSPIIRACLSMTEMLQTPGFEEVEKFSQERIRRGIELQVIRTHGEEVSNIWGTNPAIQRELRYAPRLDSFSMTMFIHDDCVSLISSLRENFGLVIQSEEFAHIQKYLFDQLWLASDRSQEVSKPDVRP